MEIQDCTVVCKLGGGKCMFIKIFFHLFIIINI